MQRVTALEPRGRISCFQGFPTGATLVSWNGRVSRSERRGEGLGVENLISWKCSGARAGQEMGHTPPAVPEVGHEARREAERTKELVDALQLGFSRTLGWCRTVGLAEWLRLTGENASECSWLALKAWDLPRPNAAQDARPGEATCRSTRWAWIPDRLRNPRAAVGPREVNSCLLSPTMPNNVFAVQRPDLAIGAKGPPTGEDP